MWVIALRLCIERLIPKAKHVSTGVDVPKELSARSLQKFKDRILYSALEGQISVQDAEKLIQLVNAHCSTALSIQYSISATTDPVEASKIYQQIMTS